MAGLMVLTSSCKQSNVSLQLLSSKRLHNFPSASALEFKANKLYVFGDDASYLLVTDTSYNTLETVSYFTDSSYRISKDTKPDIEAAAILNYGTETYLYSFGSMSAPTRRSVYAFDLSATQKVLKSRYNLKSSTQIKEWNIEGATFVNDVLVLANRANTTNQTNYLVIETFVTGDKEANSKAKVVKLSLPKGQMVTGVSGLFYEPENDILFFTASEEDTPNATSDGAIGESYLGYIENFSRKLYRKKVSANGFLKLSKTSPLFFKQKIESVCVQSVSGQSVVLHLAADNDNGKSTLFKMRLTL